MAAPLLDAEELQAIRQTIGEAASVSRTSNYSAPDATSIPLIADDRAADIARPIALKIAQRWARLIPAKLARLCGCKPTVAEVSCEAVDAETLRAAFVHPLQTMLTPEGVEQPFVFGISGAIIESIAARLLGAADTGTTSERPPSATTIRIFTPAADSISRSLDEAWHHEHGGQIRRAEKHDAEAWLRLLDDTSMMLSIRVRLEAPAATIALAARPEMFLSALPAPKLVPASKASIERVLGVVPVEVCVEVGRAKMTMRELASLQRGEVIPLYQQVEGLMPVRLAGVVKAHGKAIVSSGAFALEIVRGAKTENGQ